MRFEAFNSLPPEIRAFILISVAVAYPMFDIGFELAVYGEVFFEKIFAIWSVCTALLIALLIVPGKYFRIPAIAWFATGFPSVWFILVLVGRAIPEWSLPGTIIFTLGLVIYLACLPYVLYVAVALAYPEIALLKKTRPKIALVATALVFVAAGFVAGANHQQLLSCKDFEVTGSFVPADCRQTSTDSS